VLRQDVLTGGVTAPAYAHLAGRCAVNDAVTLDGGDLLLLTDCGLERIDLGP
jgi:hypothetical protein